MGGGGLWNSENTTPSVEEQSEEVKRWENLSDDKLRSGCTSIDLVTIDMNECRGLADRVKSRILFLRWINEVDRQSMR